MVKYNKLLYILCTIKIGGGFTIIELIVVIAIIGILAAIVMINVTKYIKSAKITAIKGDMHNAQTIAMAQYADPTNGTYNGLCGPTYGTQLPDSSSPLYSYIKAIADSGGAQGFACVANDNFTSVCDTSHWLFQAQMQDGSWWCVDSNGYAGPLQNTDPSACLCGD